ncbi:MAG: EAL domain-containing protein, partial [Flexistipes sinusarabici]
ATLALFKELSGLGVKISMDDFGTGYSSLAYLKQFPLNSIKIDKVFLQNIPDNEKDNNLIKGIIWMAKSLGLSVVAEGVENKFQSEFLREIGCDGCQGYYYSRPLPEDEFFDYLKAVMRDA